MIIAYLCVCVCVGECTRLAFLITRAMRMRYTGCGLGSIFSTLSHKRYDFRKNFTEYKMCVFILFTTFI